MKSRGRKSAAELAVPAIGASVIPFRGGPRQPPVPLTPRQREVWRSVVDSPVGELIAPEAEPLLVEYCRVAERAEQLGRVTNSMEEDQLLTEGGFSRYERYIRAQECVTRQMVRLAQALRIATSAQTHKDHAGTFASKPRGSRPWQE